MVNNYKFLREFLALRGLEMGHLNRTRSEELFLLILVIGLFSLAGDMNVLAQDHKQIVNKDPSNIAIKGYDPVAYFTENRPVKGKPEFEYPWQGARWLFSSASNRDLFAGDPKRYAPQYGGFCAGAMAAGRVASVDPEAWKIVRGKLYLGYSKSVSEKWYKKAEENIVKGDENWKKLSESNSK
jgi:hypothetical protein